MASKRTAKRAMKETTFKQYLQNEPLTSEYFLTKNKNLSFHWANWSETCEFQKAFVYKDLTNEVKLKNLNDHIAELKKTQVWLKNKRGCVRMSLYDVYEGYLDNRLRMTWFERDGILISFENEAGPYMSLANMNWFNRNIYAAFMYRKLLTQPVPYRGFRVGMNAPVKCCFDGSPLNCTEFTIHQASEHGFIMKVTGKNNVSKITHSTEIMMEIDLTPFMDTKDKSFEDTVEAFEKYKFKVGKGKNKKTVTLKTDIMEKFNNDRNAASGGGEHFYFFIPYKDLFQANHHKDLEELLQSFVNKIKGGLQTELKAAA